MTSHCDIILHIMSQWCTMSIFTSVINQLYGISTAEMVTSAYQDLSPLIQCICLTLWLSISFMIMFQILPTVNTESSNQPGGIQVSILILKGYSILKGTQGEGGGVSYYCSSNLFTPYLHILNSILHLNHFVTSHFDLFSTPYARITNYFPFVTPRMPLKMV